MELARRRAPIFRDQPTLDREMDIFVGKLEAEAAGVDLALDRAQPGDDFAPPRARHQPTFASIRACAIEPRISWR